MNLKQFLEQNNIKQVELAKILGCTKGTISKLVNKSINPSIEMADRIIIFTKEKVKLKNLIKSTSNQTTYQKLELKALRAEQKAQKKNQKTTYKSPNHFFPPFPTNTNAPLAIPNSKTPTDSKASTNSETPTSTSPQPSAPPKSFDNIIWEDIKRGQRARKTRRPHTTLQIQIPLLTTTPGGSK
jgi:transcriptional regulator with XRE-family HTH domain